MKIPTLSEISEEYRSGCAQRALFVAEIEAATSEYRELTFRTRSEKADKDRVTDLLAGKKPDTSGHSASVAEARKDELKIFVDDRKEALHLVDKKNADARHGASQKVATMLKPDHDRTQTALCDGLLQVFAALAEMSKINIDLAAKEISPMGQFVLPSFLAHPGDKQSAMVDYLKEAKRAGHCRKLPAELV